MSNGMGNVRGSSFTAVIRYIRQEFGDSAFEKILQGFSEDDRKMLAGKFNSLGWYPMKTLADLIAAADKVCGQGDYQVAYQSGRRAAEDMFGGLYRMFLEIGNPETIVGRAPFAWKIIHDVGNFELEVARANCVKVRLTEFETSHKAHCRHLAGYCEKVLELSGAKNVKVKETQCFCEGADYCEFEATWE